MRELLCKLYFKTWIRVPVKFVLTFTVMKVVWDYEEYLTNYRRKKIQPRFVSLGIFSVNMTYNLLPIPISLLPINGIRTMKAIRYFLS
jgi:hypothetical protein